MGLVKSGVWISVGLLVKNYLPFIFPPRQIESDDSQFNQERLKTLANWIGILLMIIGGFMVLTAIMTLVMGGRMPMNTFNFKF